MILRLDFWKPLSERKNRKNIEQIENERMDTGKPSRKTDPAPRSPPELVQPISRPHPPDPGGFDHAPSSPRSPTAVSGILDSAGNSDSSPGSHAARPPAAAPAPGVRGSQFSSPGC